MWTVVSETDYGRYHLRVTRHADHWKWEITQPPAKAIIAHHDTADKPETMEQAQSEALERAAMMEAKATRGKMRLSFQAPDCPTTRKRSFYGKDSALFYVGVFDAKRAYRCEFCNLWHLTTKLAKARGMG